MTLKEPKTKKKRNRINPNKVLERRKAVQKLYYGGYRHTIQTISKILKWSPETIKRDIQQIRKDGCRITIVSVTVL